MKKVLLSLLFGFAAMAVAQTAHAFQITLGKVSIIEVGTDGSFNFYLVGNPVLCSANGSILASVVAGSAAITADGQKEMLSMVTSAYLSGKNLKVYTISSGSFCYAQVIGLYP